MPRPKTNLTTYKKPKDRMRCGHKVGLILK